MVLRILKPVTFFNSDRQVINDETPNDDPTKAPVIKDFRPSGYTRTDVSQVVQVPVPVVVEVPVVDPTGPPEEIEEVEEVPKDSSATEPVSLSVNGTSENLTQGSAAVPETSHPSRSGKQASPASAAKATPPTVQLPPKTGSV